MQALVSWITSQLQSSTESSLTLVTSTLVVLIQCPEGRRIFLNSGGIGYLARHLRTRNIGSPIKKTKKDGRASVQQLYELCFCLWTLTYECNTSVAVRTHLARDGAVPALVDLVATAPREKVIRVALSALRNLATCTGTASPEAAGKKTIDGGVFLTEMIGCGLLKYVDLMKERQWTDPDIVEGKFSVRVRRCGERMYSQHTLSSQLACRFTTSASAPTRELQGNDAMGRIQGGS